MYCGTLEVQLCGGVGYNRFLSLDSHSTYTATYLFPATLGRKPRPLVHSDPLAIRVCNTRIQTPTARRFRPTCDP